MIAHVRLCPNFSESILHSIRLKIHIFDIFRIVSTFENFKSIKISFVSTFGIYIVDKNIDSVYF